MQVGDRDAMLMTRHLCSDEGMFLGGSCGMVMAGALRWMRDHRGELDDSSVLVVLMPDGGFRYLGKIYDDNWMQEHGFIEQGEVLTAGSVLDARRAMHKPGEKVVAVSADLTLSDAIDLMAEQGISQVPVSEGDELVGSLSEVGILARLVHEPDARNRLVRDIMGEPFPVVEPDAPVKEIAAHLQGHCTAVLVRSEEGEGFEILTRTDLIGTLGA